MVRKRKGKKAKNRRKRKIPRSIEMRVTNCKEMIQAEYRITLNADGFGVVNGFTTALTNAYPDSTAFQDVNQSTSYASLWKSYRITGVSYQFMPFYTVARTNDSSAVVQNELKWFWYKHMSKAALEPNMTDTNGIYNTTPKFKLFNKVIRIFVKNPKLVGDGWTDSTNTGTAIETTTALEKNDWLATTAYPNVQHYGLQFGLANGVPGATYVLKCMKTVYFQVRDTR